MSADRLIEALTQRNGFSRKPRLPPNACISSKSVEWPATFDVHDVLTKGAITTNNDFCLLSPTLKHEYLELLTLSVLFKLRGGDRPRALILTPDSSVRQRYRELSPSFSNPWSKEEFPLATVKQDGTLSQKTSSRPNASYPPRALFSRHLHYLPNSDIANEIGCVIYDGAVNYKPNRWEEFKEWRDKNDIPSVIHCLRDPLAPEYQEVSNWAGVWAWPPALIKAIIESTEEAVADSSSARYVRVRNQLDNKVAGIDREIHTVTDGSLAEQFREVWSRIEELQDVQSRLGSNALGQALRDLKRALNDFSNTVSSVGFTEQTYSEQWETLPPSNWFDRLDHLRQRLLEDETGAQASGVFRSACLELEAAYAEWKEAEVDETKQGHLYRLLYGTIERDETVTVVVPREADREAVTLDLQQRGGDLYEELDEAIRVVTPDMLAEARTCDRVVLAGPPGWRDRWVLRTPHAQSVTILAYEHQLSLLNYQFDALNDALRETTDQPRYREAVKTAADEEENTASVVDQLDIKRPGIDLGGESEVAEGYEMVEKHEPTSVEDIIDQMSGADNFRTWTDSSTSSQSSRDNTPVDCLRVCFEDGRWMPVRPEHGLHVIDGEVGGVTKRDARHVTTGNTLVRIRQTDNLRQQLYDLIKQRGDMRLIMQANLWKINLKQAIEEHDDTLDDFITRVEAEGADCGRSTYRGWYNRDVDYTRSYENMKHIAEAYDLTAVNEELEDIWGAAHQIKQTYMKLLRELRKRAYQATAGEDTDEVVLSEEHDIRLSDIDTIDERGNNLVERLTVVNIIEDTVASHLLGTIQSGTD
ncbi:DrmE family protein [Halorubrum ezzemoulense]|uniref:DrmE family protein n=1 Tax=Halorubrum ezzemoulense TaxID=337243 RepID=UPI00233110D1|nr:DrmE family protein [Halorubrum ezzemoulense]MDB9254099.1 DrmE family protein [Halorubrum ezzemoulense]MDB9257510.1 DrmE family protein [Halorubrum ezzemoulense]MDB9278150.1 DrmE family protein [Halorubrum ezzemoulense]